MESQPIVVTVKNSQLRTAPFFGGVLVKPGDLLSSPGPRTFILQNNDGRGGEIQLSACFEHPAAEAQRAIEVCLHARYPEEEGIILATYGHGSHKIDVTDSLVTKLVFNGNLMVLNKGQRCSEIFGMDPCPHKSKSLSVQYRLFGKLHKLELPDVFCSSARIPISSKSCTAELVFKSPTTPSSPMDDYKTESHTVQQNKKCRTRPKFLRSLSDKSLQVIGHIAGWETKLNENSAWVDRGELCGGVDEKTRVITVAAEGGLCIRKGCFLGVGQKSSSKFENCYARLVFRRVLTTESTTVMKISVDLLIYPSPGESLRDRYVLATSEVDSVFDGSTTKRMSTDKNNTQDSDARRDVKDLTSGIATQIDVNLPVTVSGLDTTDNTLCSFHVDVQAQRIHFQANSAAECSRWLFALQASTDFLLSSEEKQALVQVTKKKATNRKLSLPPPPTV